MHTTRNINFKPFVTSVTTLEELHNVINEELPFVTFRVQSGEDIVSNVTIPFCRFRESESDKITEIRSCDCEGTICGHPTQKLYMSYSQMKHYYFLEKEGLHYFFVYRID